MACGNDKGNLPGMEHNYTYVKGGENTFMPDTDDPQMPGKEGLKAIGGVVHHLQALTSVGCSTVNSYRRLVGYWFLGAGLCGLGFPEPYNGLARVRPGPLRVSFGRLDGQPVHHGLDIARGHG